MKFKKVLLGLCLFVSAMSFSQEVKKEVLFTVDGTPYYTDEFIRVYKKNLDLVKDDSQKDLDNYLNLFIGYKLKVSKANKLGLQNNRKYQSELKTYRTQLAKNYLTDTKVTKELTDEAYARSKKELKASHILITVDENAAPADTLKAYNKAAEARKKALAGEDFGKLAQQYSQDPSAKENQGDLGYFTVFRMVYPFESGAYNTPVGQISKIVRSRFGYHVIKVTDIRDNRGDVTVAHIMIMKPKKDNPEEAAKAKSTIEDIYKKLKQGEDFAALAKQFSQDKSTSAGGGKLNRFNSGELSSTVFEDQAFALKNPGDISAPFETQYGWHIAKLIEKNGIKSYDEVKPEFENRIRKDERSKLIEHSLTEKLKKKYVVKKDAATYAKVLKALNDKIYTQGWILPANIDTYTQTLFTINKDKKYSAKDFLSYVEMQQKAGLIVKPLSKQVELLYNEYSNAKLNAYYNDNLEDEFPEFGMVMTEYRDGLLLFDLMEKEIWEKAKNDTVALDGYYKANISKYQWKERVDAEIYSSTKEDIIKKAKKYLKKGKGADYIKAELNKDGKIEVLEKKGVFEKDSDGLPKVNEWKTGISDVIKDGGYYYVIKTNKVTPAGPKSLEESKGRVINDYQQQLESTWISDLEKEFNVQVNKDVFAKVKKQLNQ
ncbi:peptidylprolyl isomerase [Flavobacterium sp. DG1-102-2]|uniref:peptidylprolyl isomerase n=1 Tax=Flavobacterium sp. DG1-102-2 TaxID=3081663 RepID=UPI00294956DF|nr:peptidylprolyl isomerase [Flavobacterium sp. DG1-102-2]MDV6167859.1 peptidylprolyl isomerase [Flavobacterium sp. DG1-102-2]